jgi:glycosyltransferase involved in cell wall biosynthesis
MDLVSQLRLELLHQHSQKSDPMGSGFDYARGEIVITLDADLQNPPEVTPYEIRPSGGGRIELPVYLADLLLQRHPRDKVFDSIFEPSSGVKIKKPCRRVKQEGETP